MSLRVNKKHVRTIFLVLLVLGVGIGAFLLLYARDRAEWAANVGESHGMKRGIEIEGETYALREDLTTLLFLGIDTTGEMQPVKSNLNDGQCDVLALVILDRTSKNYTILQLNRDTMADVPVLGIGGKVAGTARMQLALSHTYGNGMERSCENSVNAVENFLYGAPIDHYFAINMTGLSVLIDSIGGVEVTIQDDFSQVDPSLVQGETMVLDGDQCVTYLRGRAGVGDQSNLSRAERHRDFVRGLFSRMDTLELDGMSESMAEISAYCLSDMSANRLSDFLEDVMAAECMDIVTPRGETVLGQEFMEFHADMTSVQELVIPLFCKAPNR